MITKINSIRSFLQYVSKFCCIVVWKSVKWYKTAFKTLTKITSYTVILVKITTFSRRPSSVFDQNNSLHLQMTAVFDFSIVTAILLLYTFERWMRRNHCETKTKLREIFNEVFNHGEMFMSWNDEKDYYALLFLRWKSLPRKNQLILPSMHEYGISAVKKINKSITLIIPMRLFFPFPHHLMVSISFFRWGIYFLPSFYDSFKSHLTNNRELYRSKNGTERWYDPW
jgi:hypothetical protein